jgi:hypothetical protein
MTDLCSERNNNAGCDLSLGVHNFVVFTLRGGDPDEVIGAWNFYDIEIENEGPASMRISSKCMPGVRAGPGLTRASTWSLIMVHLLENDMTLRASGKTLNLVQWDFPGQPLDHRWDDTGIVAAVTQQLRDTHPVFTRPDGSLIRIRQTGAPAGGGGGAGRRGGG